MLNDQPKLHGVVWPPCAGSDVLLCLVFPAESRAQKPGSPFLDGQPTTLSLALLPLSLVSLDVKAFLPVMVIPGWWKITKICLKR